MLLLTGPAGSGKTFRVLERLREALRRRDPGVRLLTPTATMAQHLRNQVAREGFVFRPAVIQTLSRCVDEMLPGLPQVSQPLLYWIVEEAVRRVNRPEFEAVAGLPGFCPALARTIEELSSAGCDAERLAGALPRSGAPLAEAFLAVYQAVDRELRRRGLATRSARLLDAAARIASVGLPGAHTVWLDGFHALPDPEFEVIAAMSRHADVSLTLPAASLTDATRRRLLAMGFVEEVCGFGRPQPRTELCQAASLEREADEIARRILDQAAAGRPFREMGVIVRSPELYEPVLRTVFDRFGIPARFYFDAELARHPAVRCLAGIVDAVLAGWPHAETLAALRLAGAAGDELDFAVRESLPESGLAALREIAARAAPPAAAWLRSLDELDGWRALSLAPQAWEARLRGLRDLLVTGCIEPGSYETAAIRRGEAEALELFRAAMAEAALALGEHPVSLREFWRAAKSVLRLTPLRVDDGRRNLVHVLGVHEARQWRLPVVFVCGLVEKQFPKHHAADPFFPEAARAQLQRAGIRVRTAADFEAEERFLFDWAITRATETLTLSYPRCDARGQPNLPSLYLDGLALTPMAAPAGPLLPASAKALRPPAKISEPGLLEALAQRHRAFGPSALETYLQCPFQFFGRATLRLRGAPLRPEQRLDFRTQGSIVHAVLAQLPSDPRPLDEIFDEIFTRICAGEHVPPGYRTAAHRERMLADLRALVADPHWAGGGETRTEQPFRFQLDGDVEISGRIDRLDLDPAGGAAIIDYKYSGAQNTRDRAKSGNLLQPQLYILAVERALELRAGSMFYWGLKGDVQRQGWTAPFAPEWLPQAIATTLRIAREVREGRVEPNPADPDKCRLCDFRDVCRFVADEVPACD